MARNQSAFRVGVISSIVASALVLFGQYILKVVWTFLVYTLGAINESLLSTIYKSAALGTREVSGFVVLGLAIFLVNAFAAGAFYLRMFRDPLAPPKVRSRNQLLVMWIALLVGLGLSSFVIVAVHFGDLQLNTSFNQRLLVLAPHISELEFKTLRADWAMMNSRADFRNIVTKMEAFAKANQIQLPKLLLGGE